MNPESEDNGLLKVSPYDQFSYSHYYAIVGGVLILFLAVLGSVVLGAHVAETGLHDPDSCWLLALGKFIFEKHHLPWTDPFSYTFAQYVQHAQPKQNLVMYQWLSELVFFATYKWLGLEGLLIGIASLLATIFLLIPLIFSWKLKAPMAIIIAFTYLAALSSIFHFLVRPEIFSYAFLTLWLVIFGFWRWQGSQLQWNKNMILPVVLLILSMVLWCNFHAGFVVVLGWLILYVLCELAGCLVTKQESKVSLWLSITIFIGSGLATLLNPYGMGLWRYLPRLFFAPFNKYINELKPLSWHDFLNAIFAPYLLFSILSLGLLLLYIINWQNQTMHKSRGSTHSLAPNLCFSVLVILLALTLGFSARRLIPFACLLTLYENILILSYLKRHQGLGPHLSGDLDTRLRGLIIWASKFLPVLLILGSGLGAYLVVSRIKTPTLPQDSFSFRVPIKAIAFLKQHPQKGNLFNDALFGDVLIWHLPETVPVFIDSRYDIYGAQLVRDYQRLRFDEADCDQVLEKYRIDWTFLPSDAWITERLAKRKGWLTVYKDQLATILHRPI